jgi:hypothetical protein
MTFLSIFSTFVIFVVILNLIALHLFFTYYEFFSSSHVMEEDEILIHVRVVSFIALHLIQRYKKLLSDSVEKEPLICLDEESEDVEKKSFSVVLDKNKLSLKLQNDNVKLLDPVVTSIESVKRLNESIVSVGLESPLEPLILHFSKPKMQCYFAEYIKTQIRRNAFFQPIPVSSEVEQSMGE